MADINFDDQTVNNVSSESTENTPIMEDTNRVDNTASADTTSGYDRNGSLTMEEINDPNKIKVTITDTRTPLVVLFGPPACGKTMTLIRLARFLRSQGYTIRPEETFRPSTDLNYEKMCNSFDELISSDNAAESTKRISFMLVNVSKDGKPICQILEGPGEYYFDPMNPSAPFPRYVNAILSCANRKIWMIMVEPARTNKRMGNSSNRANYVQKINRLKSSITKKDKVIFIYNKIDETDFVDSPGDVRENLAMKNTKDLYPGIFAHFMNENPITKIVRPYNFDFVPFHTGNFSKAADGTLTFDEGHDNYPKKLWNILFSRIRG